MKTARFIHATAFLGWAAFFTAASTQAEPAREVVLPPTVATVTITVTPPPAPPSQVFFSTAAVNPVDDSLPWTEIKNCSYDQREFFYAGLQKMEARVNDELAEMTASRAAMPQIKNAKTRDFAMQELARARTYFKSTEDASRKTSPEGWAQQKEKVGEAWRWTQEAYNKAKSSPTS